MIAIKVPPLGESIVEATVSRWLKQEGDAVAAGETLVELETDKVTVEVPATKAGVLVRRLQQEGDVVQLGATLGELDETAAGATTAAPPPSAPAPRSAEVSASTLAERTPPSIIASSPTSSPGPSVASAIARPSECSRVTRTSPERIT